MKFRHFDENALENIPWADSRVVVIELKGGKPVRYANKTAEKFDILRGRSTVLIAWPGEYRQDVFELRREDRKAVLDSIATAIQESYEVMRETA